ncbi:TetR/AcrR family transcriptional regulator [Caulobacter sp. NIBR2454]|uniref:TetR/AcrR family transcriptional regulator n=1 Tax=Caulobacter sp. NIBR2454 TaxID=3015996 RepID=UPI0022B6D25E|nr:TetR/AcrR family transcriptional regulator [Caulobacter sp. NIBR2454]
MQSPPLSKGAATRARIMDLAYDRIIDKGFAATSIEELVEAGSITKSGFFYHFKDKNDLARQLIDRFVEQDEALLDSLESRARSLHEDPLHSYLIFLKLTAEVMDEYMKVRPGCIVAAIVIQDSAFDAGVRQRGVEIVLNWRRRYQAWLEEIAAVHPPKAPVDLETVADQMTVIVEGGILLSKGLRDPHQAGRHILFYRETIRLLFS